MKWLLSLVLLCPLYASANLREFVEEQLAAGEKNIVIAPGRYELAPIKGHHWILENLSDVVIDATDAELVCTETTRAIWIKNCTNVTLRGLTVDYDPLPFTQGAIIEISEDRKSHVIEIMDGFPSADTAFASKHGVFRPDGMLRFGNYFSFQLEVLVENRLRIFGLHPRKNGGEQLGDVVVVATKHLSGRYIPHAVVVDASVGTVLENVTIHSSPCFGFYETHSEGSVYRDCTIDRRTGRMRSLNADAFHSKFATVGPQIVDCKAMWQGDDCVNICGAYHVISKSSGDSLRVLAKQKLDIQPGDSVELVDTDGMRLPDAKVLSIKPAGQTLEDEAVQLKKLRIRLDAIPFLKKAYVIQLDRKIELPFGSLVGSLNRKGNGFAVKGCDFGNNRSRGILIKASDGDVSGNKVENCHGQGIKIAPELYWLESGYSRNLTITGNTVVNSGEEALQIHGIGSGAGFENIRVMNNQFSSRYEPPISFPATGVEFENNAVNGVE